VQKLKILAVSDVVDDRLYTAHFAKCYRDVDIILGCGDLPFDYLEFLVTALNVPLLYVPGNHDPCNGETNSAGTAQGCDLLDRSVRRVKGLNMVGLGGSIRYRPGPPNQYTQIEMYLRILSILPGMMKSRIQTGGVLDIVITHSPPHGIHDDNDPAHIGFYAFRDFIRIFKPRFFLHGHNHIKSNLLPPMTKLGPTTIINVYPYRLLEVDPNDR
jgi:uncharacterized protein